MLLFFLTLSKCIVGMKETVYKHDHDKRGYLNQSMKLNSGVVRKGRRTEIEYPWHLILLL